MGRNRQSAMLGMGDDDHAKLFPGSQAGTTCFVPLLQCRYIGLPVMQDPIKITNHLHLPLSEIEFHFARSGGKGGQNVNKVETRVELLFDVEHSASLSDHQRKRLLSELQSRLDSHGMLRIVVQGSRSQWRNRVVAVKRLVEILEAALKPKKKRVKTKVPEAGKQKRLDEKKRRGEIKRMRSVPNE
ncbi:MAG TPA: alternative ribosome rescue aminoacyl-tRNA hydrolase ArfB [Bacteroidota bacterium]|nr:alternative ribosome rescue aminoacyl-tRNA hydrolase ArfB [Bacteroidota bacterium]